MVYVVQVLRVVQLLAVKLAVVKVDVPKGRLAQKLELALVSAQITESPAAGRSSMQVVV